MALVYDGAFQVLKVADMGSYSNNGYVLADPESRECYIVDAPDGIERLLAEAEPFHIKGCLLTHTHPDHIAGYARLIEAADVPVAVHADDEARLSAPPSLRLNDGDTLYIGNTKVQVLHTPGHTPGGVCLVVDGCLISGDTLFPGGPGFTRSREDFQQVVRNITERLLTLPEDTLVLPGHGADTTIAEAKREYTAFAARSHPDDLHGHVHWLTS
ncbi:MAG: MBL fold metallo-hydrolase [Chloroflexi bacterium]|nr:MBL fold metallo-hydrolase [Chloroflexota bacterium]